MHFPENAMREFCSVTVTGETKDSGQRADIAATAGYGALRSLSVNCLELTLILAVSPGGA